MVMYGVHKKASAHIAGKVVVLTEYLSMADDIQAKRDGKKVESLMKLAGLTQTTLAEAAGISQSQVSRVIAGDNTQMDTWRAIAKAIGVHPREMFAESPAKVEPVGGGILPLPLDKGMRLRIKNAAKRYHLKHPDGRPDDISVSRMALGQWLDADEARHGVKSDTFDSDKD